MAMASNNGTARIALALALAALSGVSFAQDSNLAAILNFETEQKGATPAGWNGWPAGTVFLDQEIVHGGKWAARMERTDSSSGDFSGLAKTVPLDFAGQWIEIRGFLRSEGVTGYFGLWAREDGSSPTLAFESMQKQQIKGTNDWKEYSIRLPVKDEANRLTFGVLVGGAGKVWADDLQVLVDGKPVWEAEKRKRPLTPNDTDHEFDNTSGIKLESLTPVQIENLATLAKVWGFLKYHHPDVTSGKRQWDYALFRFMPTILAAPDRDTANAALVKWIDELGPVAKCDPCAKLKDDDLDLRSDVSWTSDSAHLGKELSLRLQSIRENRLPGKQFYVSLYPNVGNPNFEHELGYAAIKPPDSGFQLLALFRYWNIIQYWSPNRVVMGSNWDAVLNSFIPKLAFAKDAVSYGQALLTLIAQVNDTHANLWSGLGVRPPMGACSLPVLLRFVDDQPVVIGGTVSDLKDGDVISSVDGVPVAELVQKWTPYYADSNQAARLRDISQTLTRGDCDKPAVLRINRDNEMVSLTIPREKPVQRTGGRTHDLPGEPFRFLSDEIGYVRLSGVKDPAVFIRAAEKTKGLIIDIRNYPAQFVVFSLGELLVDRETPFARFTNGDLSNPGAFHWTPPLMLRPREPHYKGKVVILIDEISQSQAEYTAMAFRAASGAVVIGSTTAGADGNVSQIPLPGGMNTMISGIGVFYPDKRPTQRIGIVPDKEVKPTIAGIRAGRDEVLEAAMREILGPKAEIPDSRKLTNH
jgi:C-terminal processing protease CtpA/Prc